MNTLMSYELIFGRYDGIISIVIISGRMKRLLQKYQ